MNLVLLTRFLPYLKTKSKYGSSFVGDQTRRHRSNITAREAIRVMLFFEYFVPDHNAFGRFIQNSRRSTASRISTLYGAVNAFRSDWFDNLVVNGSFMTIFVDFLRENVRLGHGVGDVINDAFTWSQTQEGQQYWEGLNQRLFNFIAGFNFNGQNFYGSSPVTIRREFVRLCRGQGSFTRYGNTRFVNELARIEEEDARTAEELSRMAESIRTTVVFDQNSHIDALDYHSYFSSISTSSTSASVTSGASEIRDAPQPERPRRININGHWMTVPEL